MVGLSPKKGVNLLLLKHDSKIINTEISHILSLVVNQQLPCSPGSPPTQ